MIDAHLRHDVVHTPGTVTESLLNDVTRAGRLSWKRAMPGDYKFFHTIDRAKAVLNEVVEHGAQIDCHAWCFTPHSFRLLAEDLHSLGFTRMREVAYHPIDDKEFCVVLGQHGCGPGIGRLEMLSHVESEIAVSAAPDRSKIGGSHESLSISRLIVDRWESVRRRLRRED